MRRAEEINSAMFRLKEISIIGTDTTFQNRLIYLKRNEADKIIGLKVKIEDPDGSTIYFDGSKFLLIDTVAKKVITPDSTIGSAGLASLFSDMYYMIIKKRDGKIISKNQDQLKYEGQTKIDGRILDIVTFFTKTQNSGAASTVKYYISADDYFIRRIEVSSKNAKKPFYNVMEISELDINHPCPDSIFSPRIPEDYQIQYESAKK
jgi:outer membrane lipoprotein-sorting protein